MNDLIFICVFGFTILILVDDSKFNGTYETFLCPYNFTLFKNKCYKRNFIGKTYQEAESVCNTKSGGHLATVSSAEVQKFLEEINLAQSKRKDMYIGLNRLHTLLLDGSQTSCVEMAEVTTQRMSEFDINKDCLNKCTPEVHILVTISNAQSCSAVPMYYQSMSQCGNVY